VLFMVIEHFRDNDMLPIDRRVRDQGRQLPDGLEYLDSWVEPIPSVGRRHGCLQATLLVQRPPQPTFSVLAHCP
jgi:hypothetical protein